MHSWSNQFAVFVACADLTLVQFNREQRITHLERLDCGGPMCLMRRPREHVLTFGVLEIDGAFKNDKLSEGMKVCKCQLQPISVHLECR